MSGGLIITGTAGEGDDDFDFNKWILQNDLKEIKDSLIKHKMTTINTISTQSVEFRNFMSDSIILTTKTHLISKLFAAIDKIPKHDTVAKPKHIIVTEQEHFVMDAIQTNLKELDEIQQNVNRLNKELPQSINRIQQHKLMQIANANKKIIDLFNKLDIALKNSKQKLINDLNEIKIGIENEKNIDDNKEDDILTECVKKINSEKQYLSMKLELCQEKIESMDNNRRKERKQQIMNIGNEVNDKLSESKNTLNNDCRKIEQIINKNNKYMANIDFIVNIARQENVMDSIKQIGYIINQQHGDNDNDNDEDDDIDLVHESKVDRIDFDSKQTQDPILDLALQESGDMYLYRCLCGTLSSSIEQNNSDSFNCNKCKESYCTKCGGKYHEKQPCTKYKTSTISRIRQRFAVNYNFQKYNVSMEELRYKHYSNREGEKCKLMVLNWPKAMNKDTLHTIFSPYGDIVNCDVTEQFAFIEYDNAMSSQRAMDALHGFQIGVNKLSLQYFFQIQTKQECTEWKCPTCAANNGMTHKFCPQCTAKMVIWKK